MAKAFPDDRAVFASCALRGIPGYALSLTDTSGLGMLTPIGGAAFIAA
jgi:hypothetical protein